MFPEASRTAAKGDPPPAGWLEICLAVLLAVTAPVNASGQQEAPDSGSDLLAGSVAGILPDSLQTEILVLGSTHLRRHSDRFHPEQLDRLVAALAAWEPDAVGVERLPPGFYRGLAAGEEPELGREMQARLEVDLPRAVTLSDSLIHAARDGQRLSPHDRLRLVRHLVAAHRLPTAALHWSRLSERIRAGAELAPAVRKALDAGTGGKANETYSVGVRLARARGLAEVHPIDDRTADRIFDLEEAVARGLRTALEDHPGYRRVREYIEDERDRVRRAMESGDILPLYRWKNDPETLRRDVRLQWGIFLELADETPLARKRLAHWEIRNLKMVRHIREMTLQHPGGRAVVVVGAGHKAFFDAYLDDMLGVEVVQLADVLSTRDGPDASRGGA